MNRLLLSILLAVGSALTAIAEDLVLTFGPDYTNTRQTPPASNSTSPINWSNTVNGFQWNLSNFWHTSDEMTTVACGRSCSKTAPQSQRLAKISMPRPVEKTISEIIIVIDEDSDLKDVFSIEVNTTGEYSDVIIDNIKIDSENLHSGQLSFPIATQQSGLYYEILVTTYPTSSAGFLRISKVIYKESAPQITTPSLSWSADYASATIGDDSFVEPELTAVTDDGSDIDSLIRYSSSEPAVAEIDVDGNLTILSEGTTTVTAAIEDSETVVGTSASYTLIVEQPAQPGDIVVCFDRETMTMPSDSYSGSWKISAEDLDLTVSNFCNGDGEWDYIRCGGLLAETPPAISTDFPLSDHLDRVTVKIDRVTSDNGTISLHACSETDFNFPVETITAPLAAGLIVFDVTPQPGLKYRITVDDCDIDPQGSVQISKVTFRKALEINPAEQATLFIAEPYNHRRFFQLDANTHTSSNSWIAFKFVTPDGHTLWHRFNDGSHIIDPGKHVEAPLLPGESYAASATSDPSKNGADNRNGFKLYTGDPFTQADNGTLDFYTETPDGVRSSLRSIHFTGVTAIRNISVDDIDDSTVYYNLQGIPVRRPAAPGIYIVRYGSKMLKINLSDGN